MQTLTGTFTLRLYDDGHTELFMSSDLGSVTLQLSKADNELSEALFGDQVTIQRPE